MQKTDNDKKGWLNNSDEMQESQILNQRFMELLQSKQQVSEGSSEVHNYFVTEDQQDKIRNRFRNISEGRETADYKQFRDSLGLLGREDSFISRIFHQIDNTGQGKIDEENYLVYIRTILYGNQFEKEHLGWKILSGNKGQLELKDFLQLFQEISMVWNALTGQIIQPKRKYVQQLFSIFDIDQDQTITFQDYRTLSKAQPFLFGWFQYLNNIDINDAIAKEELKKTKDLLQQKNFPDSLYPNYSNNVQQIKFLLADQETILQNKMTLLNKELFNVFELSQSKLKMKNSNLNQSTMNRSRRESVTSQASMTSFYENHSTFSSTKHFRNHQENMSRLKKRKQKMEVQSNRDANIEVIKELQKIMDRTYRLMNICSEYRELKGLQKKNSPNKMKLKEVKFHLVSKAQEEEEQKEKGNKKKKNITVYLGHQNWNLVLNLMVGLRKSIKSLFQLNSYLELKPTHFSEEHEFLLGNKFLNGKSKEVFKFVAMAPVLFQKLRHHYGISNVQYQKSVGPETLLNSLVMGNLTALNEKCSTGKSGSFFYLTLDNKVFLKTIPKHQFVFFVQILQQYYKHQKQFTNSLIVRMYGLYKLKVYINKQKVDTIYFISMENIFKDIAVNPDISIKIKEVYDLKGSLYGRSGEQGKQLKDNDWLNKKKKIHFTKNLKQIFKNQVKVDAKFFKHNNINDYSLLVAVCEIDHEVWEQERKKQQNLRSNIFKWYKGGIFGRQKGQFYILSIIDILTVFETKKNLQYIFKSTFLSKDVSCIPPAEYSKRFRQFMYSTVEEDETQ